MHCGSVCTCELSTKYAFENEFVEHSMSEERTSNSWWSRHDSSARITLRIVFGLVWIIDGAMKFIYMVPSNVVDMVQGAGQGQPDWLVGWYSFWTALVSANPAFVLYAVGALELLLGILLVLGLMRKIAYFGGIILSLVIWSIDEGFGGPYGPGSTDIGAAIMYVFVFVALVIIDSSSSPGRYSLDAVIVRKVRIWTKLAFERHQ
jgi:uncharacterized membrane protein YphA (DoxX/SURF4 family)